MRLQRERGRNQGAVLVIVAVGMVVFCVIAALVIDMGRVYIQRNRIQEVTEAAAIAGSQKLGQYVAAGVTIDGAIETEVKETAVRFAKLNGIEIEPTDVVVTGDRVYITKSFTLEYTFARILGSAESQAVGGTAISKVNADGTTSVVKNERYNVMPWAMPHGQVDEPYNLHTGNVAVTPVNGFTPGQEYILKLGAGPMAGGIYYPEGTQVLVPMGGSANAWDQWNIGFKRAYGLAFWLSHQNIPCKWLLGYRGGSFMFDLNEELMRQLGATKTDGGGEFGSAGIFLAADHFQWVKYTIVEDPAEILAQTVSMIVLDRAPRVGVYGDADDAVTLTLNDAGVPYTMFHQSQLLAGALANYDWLHLHHEDFTGVSDDAGAGVPYITASDGTGSVLEGPSGGILTITGANFVSESGGNRNIRVWFQNVQMRLTDTALYSVDFTSSDGMLANADDAGRFQVTATVPVLPNGTYNVYAQVLDQYTTPVEYMITGSTVNPVIQVFDTAGKLDEGAAGDMVFIAGHGFGPNAQFITLKMDGAGISGLSSTDRYADDGFADGFISATPGGSFEVRFAIPGDLSAGTKEIRAVYESVQSNAAYYIVRDYRNPKITLTDNLGDPLKGPNGYPVTVTGSGFRPNQAGIYLRIVNSFFMVVSDTAAYSGDQVVGGYAITADPDGNFQVSFQAPDMGAAGVYPFHIMYWDAGYGQFVYSNTVSYDIQDLATLTSELTLDDKSGDPLSGEPGGIVTASGLYFDPSDGTIKLYFFKNENEPLAVTVSDTATYPDDAVLGGNQIRANPQGRFAISFPVPDLPLGTYEVRARHKNDSVWSATVIYTIAPNPRLLTLRDAAEPYDSGTAGGSVTVTGSGFSPNAANLVLYFSGVAKPAYDTPTYPTDAASGGAITADEFGRFEVSFATPYTAPGNFTIQVTDGGANASSVYPYALTAAEDFWTASNPDYNPKADSFTIVDTLHMRVMSTGVNPAQLAIGHVKITCAYHGTHTITLPLENLGNFHYRASIPWASMPGIHNGDWEVAFRLEDVDGNSCTPETVVHVSGVANVTEAAYLSRLADFSDQKPILSATERQYFKIQSPLVDYSIMSEQFFQFVCRTRHEAVGYGDAQHNTGPQAHTNHWDGTWTGSYQCPAPDQHFGEYLVRQRLRDALDRVYENEQTVHFFPNATAALLVSAHPYLDYETSNFYKQGNLYARTFSRNVNHLTMSRAEYRYARRFGNNWSSASRYNFSPAAGFLPLVNEGNGLFKIAESLSPYQDRTDYKEFRLETYLLDTNNNQYYTTKLFTLRETVSANPLHESWRESGGNALGALRSLAASAGRGVAAALHPESPLRRVSIEFIDRVAFVDGAPLSAPDGADAPRAVAGNPVPAWLAREPGEPCGHATLPPLLARYLAAPADDPGATWWAREGKGPADFRAAADAEPGFKSWFASPAHAQVKKYAGKFDVVHAIRNWVVNGGYLFAMCYGSETMDITLSKDITGNTIGYEKTFAFKDFGTNRINDNDAGNFTLADMSANEDPFGRPLASVQGHMTYLSGFVGSTAAYRSQYVKSATGPRNDIVHVLGRIDEGTVKYLAAPYGAGWFTFLGGHDPRRTEVYRLILNHVLLGSLSPTVPATGNLNSGALDMDATDDGKSVDIGEYGNAARFGYPPALLGELATAYPGDLPEAKLLHTLPYDVDDPTRFAVDHLVSSDMARAEPGEVHTWRTPEYASSRYVLVPIVEPSCVEPHNTGENDRENVYQIRGRDRVRLLRYGLFFVSRNRGNASGDADLFELGSTRRGEVRGKFIGYLK